MKISIASAMKHGLFFSLNQFGFGYFYFFEEKKTKQGQAGQNGVGHEVGFVVWCFVVSREGQPMQYIWSMQKQTIDQWKNALGGGGGHHPY